MSLSKEYRVDAEAGIVYGKRGKPIGSRDGDGYLLIKSAGRNISPIHRFIWESVHGPIPTGLQINHINGIKTDNRISNLELVTPAENVRHAWRSGLNNSFGQGQHLSKLNDAAVRTIRASPKRGRELASEFGVSYKTIRNVINWATWRHVGAEA